jgi:hypothetical protein
MQPIGLGFLRRGVAGLDQMGSDAMDLDAVTATRAAVQAAEVAR